ncbi:hypothetical protein AB0C02_01020 [Micromonospora sp. NPDC048999]|uniref:hypothetical protein n=1 Tax=Micromonospora sp. NPDC048999 TaxID=3155391 RepID=UPI0033FC5A8C
MAVDLRLAAPPIAAGAGHRDGQDERGDPGEGREVRPLEAVTQWFPSLAVVEWREVAKTINADRAGHRMYGIGEDGDAAGRRLAEMRDFYDYLWRELPALIDRWQTQKET